MRTVYRMGFAIYLIGALLFGSGVAQIVMSLMNFEGGVGSWHGYVAGFVGIALVCTGVALRSLYNEIQRQKPQS